MRMKRNVVAGSVKNVEDLHQNITLAALSEDHFNQLAVD